MYISTSSSYLFTLTALTGLSTAASIPSTKQAFSVEQVATGESLAQEHPAKVLLSTYKKFNAVESAPQDVVMAANAAGNVKFTASATAYPASQWDEKYYCPVTIGTQSFNLSFDTGSADTWVFSNLMPAYMQAGHNVYNVSATGTVMKGYSWGITYGDSSGASGVVYSDKVAVGAATVTSMAVEAATSASSSFLQDTQGSGMIGLAWKNINGVSPQQQNTFFGNVGPQLDKNLFAVTLRKGASGSFDFGYIDHSRYTGRITYMPIVPNSGYWMLDQGAYRIGQQKRVIYKFNKIVDTGTSLLLLPQQIVKDYYKTVDGAGYDGNWGGYVFPCNSHLSRIGVRVGGTMFFVPGPYLSWSQINQTHCFGGLQPSTGLPFSILGDVFLKAVYAVFDVSGKVPRIGLARQVNLFQD